MQVLKKWTTLISAANQPIATAEDGETLVFVTRDCFNGTVQKDTDLQQEIDEENANPATGPLYIRGAEPGDALGVDILDIRTADHGVVCTFNEKGPLWQTHHQVKTKVIPVKKGWAYFEDVRWPIDPMIGVIGTALPDRDLPSEWVSEGGGNMDSRKIRKGATLWLPVRVPGALLTMGDVHATMGDGEVTATGLEIAARIKVRVHLVKHFELNWPVTETRKKWYVNTCGPTCDDAIEKGYLELHRLLMNAYGWSAVDTAMYMSLQGYVEANQAVLTPAGGGNTFRVGTPKVKGKPRLIP